MPLFDSDPRRVCEAPSIGKRRLDHFEPKSEFSAMLLYQTRCCVADMRCGTSQSCQNVANFRWRRLLHAAGDSACFSFVRGSSYASGGQVHENVAVHILAIALAIGVGWRLFGAKSGGSPGVRELAFKARTEFRSRLGRGRSRWRHARRRAMRHDLWSGWAQLPNEEGGKSR